MDYNHSRFPDTRLYDDFSCSIESTDNLRVGAVEDQDGVFLDASDSSRKVTIWLSWENVTRLRSLLKSLAFEGTK